MLRVVVLLVRSLQLGLHQPGRGGVHRPHARARNRDARRAQRSGQQVVTALAGRGRDGARRQPKGVEQGERRGAGGAVGL